MFNKLYREEGGQSLVLVALALLAMLALVALVLDGGNAYAQRRRVQNAADAGAVAGARELALGGTDGQIYAKIDEYTRIRNGATSFEAVYIPGGELVGGGAVPSDASGVRVEAVITFPTFFAGVIGLAELTASTRSGASYGAVAEMSQGVYPIGANWQNYDYGQTYDIWHHEQGGPGNFGWLSWWGCNSVPCLRTSLTPPGNSEEYVNPHDPDDHILSIGDWVEGMPGVKSGAWGKLDDLIGVPITIIIWDEAEGQGANLNYHIAGFAEFVLEGYDKPKKITGRFIRWVVPTTDIHFGTSYGAYGVRLVE